MMGLKARHERHSHISCAEVLVQLAPRAPCHLQGLCSGHTSSTHKPHSSRLAIGGPLSPERTVELPWKTQSLC